MQKRRMEWFYRSHWASRLFFCLLFLALWEVTAVVGHISPLLLPRVEAVALALWRGFTQGTLLGQTLFSLGVKSVNSGLMFLFCLTMVAPAWG